MDSFSSFTEAAVGEVSVLTSLTSLLAVAKALGSNLSEIEKLAERYGRAIIFAFFHGESLGYIGSSAAVNDIEKGEFPLDIQLADIDSFIESHIPNSDLSCFGVKATLKRNEVCS
ncbi:unnamed protein product [Gongylonema pulchrum]|uniref:ANF_receptor domain-containing protein n=1 Tax=Gongylonema pulchrum TaxID=637853 RepID=A0A183D7Y3_9BILA|nr:unnamed protein product [Gongylonema pulchrum]